MNQKPSLQDFVRAFFIKRLFIPFAVIFFCALGAMGALKWRDFYREQVFFAKVLDRHVTVFLSGVYKTLREKALSFEEADVIGKDVSFSSPAGFHRVFLFESARNQTDPLSDSLQVPVAVDIPTSYFPRVEEWPMVSVPYFSGRLKTLTLALMVRGDRATAVGELNLDSLQKLIDDFSQTAPENIIILLDRFGNVIYHPDEHMMHSQENLSHEPLVKRILRYNQPKAFLGKLGRQPVIAYSWCLGSWNWVLLVAKPVTCILAPSLFWGVLTAASVFCLLFLLLLAFRRRLDQLVVRPISLMTNVLEALARQRGAMDLESLAKEAPFSEMAFFAQELERTSRVIVEREAALIARGRELYRILESIGDGVILTDALGRIVQMNAEAEQITGWYRTQAVGHPVWRILDLVDTKTEKHLEDIAQRVLTAGTGEKISTYTILNVPDGSQVVVTLSTAPVRDDSGQIQGIVLVLRDAGAEYEAQRLLEESERKYREVMETMEEAYMELDPSGCVTFCNPALLKILDCSSDDLKNRSYRDFTDEATAERMRAFFSEIYTSESSRGLEDFVIHDDAGRRKVVEISAGVRRAEDGNILGFRVLARDITEKAAALEHSRSLERMLMHTQKMESLGTLASGIAHEFNNLLQAMSGYLEMALGKTDAQDPRSRWLTRVQEASFRAQDLVQRLLSFARQKEPSLEPLDFNQVVDGTLDLLKKSIPRMIEIRKDLAPNLPALVADRLQVEQVVINLTANARDAIGPDKSGIIRVRTIPHIDEQGRQWIRLEVSDTGSGIPEEIRERIFDPFFTTKEPGKGTGLGLSTVYGIVTAHEGRIHCESQVGQGTTFQVDFPLRSWAAQPADLTEKLSADEDGLAPVEASVLVVDDEESLLELVQGLLEMAGYKVRTAHSGEEALALLARQNGRIDAVVLDLSMPGMGGRRCLELLRENHPKLPVIVASGDVAHEIFRDPENFGAQGVIPKPYRLKDLMETLHRVLRPSGGKAAAGRDGA